MTIDMVKKVLSKLKFGKAAGPSGVVMEMVRAAGDTGANMIRNLAIAIIRDHLLYFSKKKSSNELFDLLTYFIRDRHKCRVK